MGIEAVGRVGGVRINELAWDEWNDEHIARHGVTQDEVEEIADSAPHILRSRGGTYRLIGQTFGGRLLTVVVSPRGSGVFYVVTARDADADERRAYRRH
jgi:uncharacterized DUF497 family protein